MQPSFPTFFTHPHNNLASTQFNQASPNLLETLVTDTQGGSSFLRLPSIIPASSRSFSSGSLVPLLSSFQALGKIQVYPKAIPTSLSALHPSSVWLFRPGVFSQTRLFSPTKHAPLADAHLTLLSLTSFYSHSVGEVFGNPDSSLLGAGV